MTMGLSLENKVILITGASSGIGEALARQCAAKKAKVIVVGRSREKIKAVTDLIYHEGGEAYSIVADICRTEDVQRITRESLERWERIDVLVNNAGYGVHGNFADVSLEIIRNNFETNFFATLNLTKSVLPYMIGQKSGMIVNIESIVSLRSMPSNSSYSATKHALHAMSEAMRIELAPSNINVLSVCPGLIRTNFSENRLHVGEDKIKTPPWLYMPASKCAAKIIRAIEKNKRQVVITNHAKIIAFLQRLSPSLVDFILAKNYP